MQMVIMAGGLGTRLGPRTQDRPKSLVPVLGKPFLERQIDLIQPQGVTRLVLCIGHLGEQIVGYFGDGSEFGVQMAYSSEGDSLLGTGGALKKAEPLLDEKFFLMWGDSYLRLDYPAVWEEAKRQDLPASMVVYRNDNQRVPSNVVLKEGKVAVYDKWQEDPDKVYIDNGLTVLKKEVLQHIPAGQAFAIEEVFRDLAREGRLGAIETPQPFYEIGSPAGLRELEELLAREQEA
ncbi:MAG: sugar phosphate nucleotidyltransferase [Desulfarculaceae bacterium]|jgi:NDP-sugar pyrophosphorylase family protein